MHNPEVHKELQERGLIEHAGGGTFEEIFAEPRKMYLGIDPTADSLHVGNMVSVILMKHLYDAGNEPYFLVGGGTGMIGDPKPNTERTLLDEDTITKNTEAIRQQLSGILEKKDLLVVDNADWLLTVPLVSFLRDIGKHFTVNQLIKRDIIKRRLDTEEDSISYTEFSYSLLQAYDYLHLHEAYDIDMQIGGTDQWANIISGIDLIRRKKQSPTYAVTTPIVVDKSSGKKFGKSEGNAVWLDPTKTSPFTFYQFWINVADESVEEYLKIFSFIPLEQIETLIREHQTYPQARLAQKALAREVTTFVHGVAITDSVEKVSDILYGQQTPDLAVLNEEDIRLLCKEVATLEISTADAEHGIGLVDILVQSELATSKSDARRLLESGAVSIGENKMSVESVVSHKDFINGVALLRKGKRIIVLVLL